MVVVFVSVVVVAGMVSALVFVAYKGGLSVIVHTSPSAARELVTSTAQAELPLPDGQDWTQYRFDVTGTGLNPEGRISTNNMSQLALQWTFSPQRGFVSTPAIVNGIVYVTYRNSLYAFELATGKVLWHFDDISQPGGSIFSSVAVDPNSHIAYYGTPDARVYAVNALTGREIWNVQIGDPDAGAFIWSSPLLVNGKVYIGLASHDDSPCVRGGVFAFDATTGKLAWTHYMVRTGTLGGSVWSSLTADPRRQEIIATTGNPCPHGNSDDQQDAFIAMDWNTGATLWQYTAVPYDDCDCDFGEGAVDFTYHGQEYLIAGNKNGIVYALTQLAGRHSVRLVWSLRITKSGFLGSGGIFEPPTYSDGVVYIAGGPTLDGVCKGGALYALHADTGEVRWRACTSGQVVSPASTTGDVLFVAQRNMLVAYEADTGRELLRSAQPGEFWGGVSISRGSVLVGGVAGTLYCYSLPKVTIPGKT